MEVSFVSTESAEERQQKDRLDKQARKHQESNFASREKRIDLNKMTAIMWSGGIFISRVEQCSKFSYPRCSGGPSIPSDDNIKGKRLFTAGSLAHASDRTAAANKPGTGAAFPLQDVLEAQQFDRPLLTSIFEVAREMEDIEKERDSSRAHMLRGFLMATLFYEPSTRTRLSFESAMKRLGGEVLTTENAREFSSAAKGETLEGVLTHSLLRRHRCTAAPWILWNSSFHIINVMCFL